MKAQKLPQNKNSQQKIVLPPFIVDTWVKILNEMLILIYHNNNGVAAKRFDIIGTWAFDLSPIDNIVTIGTAKWNILIFRRPP